MSYDTDWATVQAFAATTGVTDAVLERHLEDAPLDDDQTARELAYLTGVHDVMMCLPHELQEWLVTQAKRDVRADW